MYRFQGSIVLVIGVLALFGLLLVRAPSGYTGPGSLPESLQQNALYGPDEKIQHTEPHFDSCVPEYLRNKLAPELLDTRLRIQDMKFYQTILSTARELKAAPGPVTGHEMFKRLIPVVAGGCPTMKRMPESEGLADGGKWLCGIDNLAEDRNCSIFSLGSNNQFDFEVAMAEHTGCHLHTFDCTVKKLNIPPSLKNRMTFHRTCLGADGVPDKRFKSLSTISKKLGASKLKLLKMDIESSEWSVLRAMFEGDWSALPDQFSVELHYNLLPMSSTDYVADPHDLALFSIIIHLAGFRAIAEEANPLCNICSEFTFVRTRCPEREVDAKNRL